MSSIVYIVVIARAQQVQLRHPPQVVKHGGVSSSCSFLFPSSHIRQAERGPGTPALPGEPAAAAAGPAGRRAPADGPESSSHDRDTRHPGLRRPPVRTVLFNGCTVKISTPARPDFNAGLADAEPVSLGVEAGLGLRPRQTGGRGQ